MGIRMNIFKSKAKKHGRRLRQLLKNDFDRMGRITGDDRLINSAVYELECHIERSERMKALNRKRKADKHAITKDLFG